MRHTTDNNTLPPAHAQRSADRFDTELPVGIDGTRSLTKNISATGVFFETDTRQLPGARIQFTVEVVVRGQKFELIYNGEVTRIEKNDDKTGVAVKLDSSFFSDVDKV